MKIAEGPLTAISGWPRCMQVKRAYDSRNRHFAEWRFLPFMRIVTVSPKIWKVNVIGIGTPPFGGFRGQTALRALFSVSGSSGFQRTSFSLSRPAGSVNCCRLPLAGKAFGARLPPLRKGRWRGEAATERSRQELTKSK